MPHIELNWLSVPPGAAEWTVFVLMLLGGLCFVGLAVSYARGARRPAGAGQHRPAAPGTAPMSGGRTAVCAALGVALLAVAASILAGIATA
ncbi:hypothetical protein F4561_004828 [Lipingzhangella halophila]|uniref:Uncharacterized protein n=1 Tax=Lipingzhangella halophila TaxID=1783352 RepID=A0A7W7RL60_9ACTN|nr:hypothetical protein [Lipingzhangella halophila]MBB4934008.1 hypothetical protein [Lipingzhangella halophila]